MAGNRDGDTDGERGGNRGKGHKRDGSVEIGSCSNSIWLVTTRFHADCPPDRLRKAI